MIASKLVREELTVKLNENDIQELFPLQEMVLNALKSGKDHCVQAPEGSGETISIAISVLQKIEEAGEGSPRALVICKNDDEAKNLYEWIEKLGRHLDITVDLAHEKGNMLKQRNDIFDGTEIIVGTPKRMFDLYIQNGYNVSQMKLFIMDDAQSIFIHGFKMQMSRLIESLPKCQKLFFSENFADRRWKEFQEEFVPFCQTIAFDPEKN